MTTPKSNADEAELRKHIDKLLHIQFERGKAETAEDAPLWWDNHGKWPTLNDAIMQIITAHTQAAVDAARIEQLEHVKKYALSPTGLLNIPELADKMPSILWVIGDRIDGKIAELQSQLAKLNRKEKVS